MTLRFVSGLIVTAVALAQDFDSRPAQTLRNGKLELTVLNLGGTLAHLTMQDDTEKLSPFWNSDRAQRAAGGAAPARPTGSLGHFLCLDGFGAPSKEEQAAGWPTHGEAYRQQFQAVQENPSTLKMTATLPLAQQIVTRTVTLSANESVVYVNTEVENQAAFDRPVSWAEHATIGPPFLASENTVIDLPGTNCRVRAQKGGSTGTIAYDKDFVWPMGPLTKGGTVDLTAVPVESSLDLAACRIDPARVYGYVTAVRRDKGLIFGYVFKREEYPWIMNWMNYSGNARAARGVEFSTQPFDVSHRETVEAGRMFDTPTYKWLPGKGKLRSSFLLFYAKTPAGFDGVSDVKLENGQLTIRDKSGHTMTLDARRGL